MNRPHPFRESRSGTAFAALRSRCLRLFLPFLLAVVLGLSPSQALAGRGGEICERAARLAAQRTGVPLDVLRAISLTETGRRDGGVIRPWPWTVNMEGRGVWFDSFAEALAFATENFDRGARSFDVGCFQLNFKWHGRAFSTIAEMFDPERNALYAAGFLRELFAETGSWTEAAGAYHSRTPEYAARYKKRFRRHLARLSPEALPREPSALPLPAAARPGRIRENRYPLLLGGPSVPASLGSLMPSAAGRGAGRLIGGG